VRETASVERPVSGERVQLQAPSESTRVEPVTVHEAEWDDGWYLGSQSSAPAERLATSAGLELGPSRGLLEELGERAIRGIVPRRRRGRAWLMHRWLASADVLGLVLAFAVVGLVFGGIEWGEIAYFAATMPLWVITAKLYGLYDRDEHTTFYSTVDDLVSVFHVLTVGMWLLLGFGRVTGVTDTTLTEAMSFWAVAIVTVVALRALARTIAVRNPLYVQRAIIVGAGDVGQTIARKVLTHPEYGLELLGFVDERPRERPEALADLEVLGSLEDVTAIVNWLDVERVIVAFSNESHEAYLHLLRQMTQLDVEVDVVPRLFEVIGPRVQLDSVEGIPLIGLRPPHLSRSSRLAKRTMDLVLCVLGVLVLSPFLLAAAVAIRTTSRGPALFRQLRVGQHGQTFHILKFRTMVANAEALKCEVGHLNVHLADDPRMFKIPDDPRVTGVGKFLRRWDLDELAQLFNVIRGDMSLVGPRPLILEEDAFIKTWGRRRLDLKPGVTGPWQALGASTIPFDEMVRLDYLYITNWSLYEDVKWIWRTIARLVNGRHSY
jgi:exopolysaccharide biosynthesis polyprenyl glycosylphosphotransferase